MARKELVEIYVPIVDEVKDYDSNNLPMGLKKSDIKWYCYGRTAYPCVVTLGTPEEKKRLERIYDSSLKSNRRSHRCLLPDNRGSLYRCSSGNCEECEWRNSEHFTTGKLSYEKLTQGDSEEDKTYDIPSENDIDPLDTIEEDEIKRALISSLGVLFCELFELLEEGYNVQEMADMKGVARSTMSDWIRKMAPVLEPFKDYFYK